MNELLKLILKLSISGSVFFLLFYILSCFTRKALSAKWHLFILKVNMVFFLIPIVLIYDILPKRPIDISINSFNIVVKHIESSSYFAATLFTIWAIGVVVLTIWNLYCYGRFVKSIKKSSYDDKILKEAVYKCKMDLNITANIKVQRSYMVSCPMVIGIIKPTIIFPDNMKYNTRLTPVIIHELTHCERNDLLFKLVQLIISVVYWFNPIVYIMNNNFEKWCEISCDEIVAENMSYVERKEYGNTILSIIENINDAPNFLCFYLCNDKKYIKRRLTMMLNMKKTNNFKKIFGGLLVCGVVLVSAGISVVATPTNINFENVTIDTNDENVRNLFQEQLEEFKAEIDVNEFAGGSIVVMDTETGEVLGTCTYNVE